jgi:hypothetical protein
VRGASICITHFYKALFEFFANAIIGFLYRNAEVQYEGLNAGLGAVYGPLGRHMLPVSMYHTDVNVFQPTVNTKHTHAGLELKFKTPSSQQS